MPILLAAAAMMDSVIPVGNHDVPRHTERDRPTNVSRLLACEYDARHTRVTIKNQYLFLRRPRRIRSADRPPWLSSTLQRCLSQSRWADEHSELTNRGDIAGAVVSFFLSFFFRTLLSLSLFAIPHRHAHDR